ncbi:MAG: hypothetical protein AAF517_12255, partial [Planctomycetota bacterium]
LVAFPGVDWSVGISEELQTVLGIDGVGATRDVPADLAELVNKGSVAGMYRELDLPEGSDFGESRAFFSHEYHLGRAFTASWTPSTAAFPSGQAAPVLWCLLEEMRQSSEGLASARDARLPRDAQGFVSVMSQNAELSVPSGAFVFFGGLCFIYFGIIAPWYRYRERRHERRVFRPIVIACVGCVGGILFLNWLIRSSDIERIDYTVMDVVPDGSRARAQSVVSYSTPTWSSFDPNVAEGVRANLYGMGDFVLRGREARADFVRVDLEGTMSMPVLDLSPSAPRYVRYEYWVDELPFEVKDVDGGYEVTNLGDKNLHVSLLWSGKNRSLLQTVTVPPGETSNLIRGRRQSESHRTGDHPLEDYQWQRVSDWRGKSPRAVSGCESPRKVDVFDFTVYEAGTPISLEASRIHAVTSYFWARPRSRP